MSKRQKPIVDEDSVLFEMPNESVDADFDDTDLEFDCDDIQGSGCACHADAFNLPVDAPELSRILSMEHKGQIMIRDKQVFPCPKEGCVQVYVEYVET